MNYIIKKVNIGKYNEIYESINAAFKSLENHNPHMKVGLHPHVYQAQGLMLPFTSRTFSRFCLWIHMHETILIALMK